MDLRELTENVKMYDVPAVTFYDSSAVYDYFILFLIFPPCTPLSLL